MIYTRGKREILHMPSDRARRSVSFAQHSPPTRSSRRRLVWAFCVILLVAPMSWLAEAATAPPKPQLVPKASSAAVAARAASAAAAAAAESAAATRPRPLHFLLTQDGREVMNNSEAVPLPEYPRPQLQRDTHWISLNGWWEWQEVRGRLPAIGSSLQHRVRVPFPVESPLSGLAIGGAAAGLIRMRYRRSFAVPHKWGWPERCSVRLHLGAVDWQAVVFVNGMRVVAHSGGFAPFSANIDEALRAASRQGLRRNASRDNVLEVDVYDPTDTRNQGQPLGKQRSLSGGIWYTSVSGIWGSVWLEQIPLVASISHLQLRYAPPSQLLATVSVQQTQSRTRKPPGSGYRVYLQVQQGRLPGEGGPGNAAGKWAAAPHTSSSFEAEGRCSPARWVRELPHTPTIRIDQVKAGFGELGEVVARCNETLELRHAPMLWSPESPVLYGVVAKLYGPDGSLLDVVRSYTGLRTVSVLRQGNGPARIALNGRARFSAGVLDQGYWPDGVYVAPTDRALAADIEHAKRLGFDLVRKHAKVEPARWYYHADRLGVLVWQDMPSPPALSCQSPADGDPAWKRKKFNQQQNDSQSLPPRQLAADEGDDEDSAEDEGPERKTCPVDKGAFAQELRDLVTWLSFPTSIIVWVIFNEGWGQHDTDQHVRLVRALDSSRLVSDASGWFVGGEASQGASKTADSPATWLEAINSRLAPGCASEANGDCGDIIDVHAYPGPTPARRIRRRWYGAGLWERLGWGRSTVRASVVGEFGGARFEVRGHTQGAHGWGYGQSAAQDCDQFVAELAAFWHSVAKTSGLSACVYTQLTDVEGEWNGMLTYDRVLKCGNLLSSHVAPAIANARRALTPET